MSRVKYSHTCTARGSDTDGVSHKTPVFVANVNVDGGKLKVNVNRFERSPFLRQLVSLALYCI